MATTTADPEPQEAQQQTPPEPFAFSLRIVQVDGTAFEIDVESNWTIVRVKEALLRVAGDGLPPELRFHRLIRPQRVRGGGGGAGGGGGGDNNNNSGTENASSNESDNNNPLPAKLMLDHETLGENEVGWDSSGVSDPSVVCTIYHVLQLGPGG